MPCKDITDRRDYQRKYMKNVWYPLNKEKHIALVRESKRVRVAKTKEAIRAIKDVPCMDCSIRYPSYVMDFDHVGPKNFLISRSQKSLYNILEEIKKCEIVCANCHRERTFSRGQVRI